MRVATRECFRAARCGLDKIAEAFQFAGHDMAESGIVIDLMDQVLRLSELTKEAGLDGVVASPLEIGVVRPLVRPGGWIVVPGIRPAGSDAGDQQRTAEPVAAVKAGATHLVVGRPITQAREPTVVFEALCRAAT